MKKIALSTILLALPMAAIAQAPAAPAKGDPAAGKTKAVAICSGCHGVPGTKTAYPEVYNVDRYNQTMKALATALTEKEIADIAAYYGQK